MTVGTRHLCSAVSSADAFYQPVSNEVFCCKSSGSFALLPLGNKLLLLQQFLGECSIWVKKEPILVERLLLVVENEIHCSEWAVRSVGTTRAGVNKTKHQKNKPSTQQKSALFGEWLLNIVNEKCSHVHSAKKCKSSIKSPLSQVNPAYAGHCQTLWVHCRRFRPLALSERVANCKPPLLPLTHAFSIGRKKCFQVDG